MKPETKSNDHDATAIPTNARRERLILYRKKAAGEEDRVSSLSLSAFAYLCQLNFYVDFFGQALSVRCYFISFCLSTCYYILIKHKISVAAISFYIHTCYTSFSDV